MKKLKVIWFFLIFGSLSAHGKSFQINLYGGVSSESFSTKTREASRFNTPVANGDLEFHLFGAVYASVGLFSVADLAEISLPSFGIQQELRWYFYGTPNLKTKTSVATIDLQPQYGFYVGALAFQRFFDISADSESRFLGGVGLSGGGFYNLNSIYYIPFRAALVLGNSSSIEYTSLEFYSGLGIRF